MDWHAFLIRGLIGPLWARWERSPYLRLYRSLKRSQYDDPTLIRHRQWSAVQDVLRHAHATVPYYRKLFDRQGINPANIRGLDDFCRVPVLTKADLRAYSETMISNEYDRATLHRKRTS